MDEIETEDAWFLAQIKPNCYKMAARNLRRQHIKTFLPMHEETNRRAGRFVSTRRPLFTGYMFVAVDSTKGDWRAVNSTYGVGRLVSFGAAPHPVPSALILHLMQRCDASGTLLPPPALKPGDAVKLTSGPFAEFAATVEKMAADQRVWVLLDLMGRQARISTAPETVQML